MATKEMFKRPGDPHDISFYINGTKHEVSDKFPPTTSLNDYIRDVAGLKGTKVMCKEAGCGCCAVAVTHAFAGDKMETMSINSCLCPLYSIDGWQISTVEGIGSQRDGFHPIQERIAEYNGTQCGYCTPGFVMGMYGLLHKDSKPTQQEIEDSLDSHVCRCTGYRAILDAMKSFGSDATSPGAKCIDIEDLNMKLCPKTGDVCKREGGTGCASSSKADTHLKGHAPTPLTIDLRGSKWYRPLCLADLGWILRQHEAQSTRMVFGNTGAGIYKHEGPFEIYIDLRAVKELHKVEESDTSILFGAGTTITKFKDYLQTVQQKPGFHYSSRVVRHLKVVANVLVRNAGSMAGNLMIKHKHPDFPSDLFTILTAIDAQVDIFDSQSSQTTRHSMMEFLKEINMDGKVLVAVEIPALGEKDHYRSFKITPRWQNAHAYVNAAFKITVDGRRVVGKPNCVFGGLNSETVNVTAAEDFLKDKELNNAVITQTLKILYSEIDPSCDPILSSPNYRKNLAVNLLYKALLEIYKPSKLSLQSGADSMERPLSVGLQTFQEKPEDFPLKKPTPKVTAPLQASGEAVYINDIPTYQKELHAAFVISDVGPAKIAKVDASAALNIPGVVNFLGAADIPREGVNNSVPANPLLQWTEELFASEVVEYAGQGIGIILAETQALAEEGARQVQISYEDVQKPIVDIEEAIEKNTIFESATQERIVGDPEGALNSADHVVEGTVKEGTQYHFALENQVALVVPSEDGLDVHSATQWTSLVQQSVAQVLGKPHNYANVITPRIGGAFGGKILQTTSIASAAAVAAEATGRPVRLNVDLSTNMKFSSKRFPILAKYKAACDKEGKMQAIIVDIYVDSGSRPTVFVLDFMANMDQGFYIPNWKVTMRLMKTDKPIAAPVRGPGAVPASLITESILEHLAREIGMHPILLKELNLYEKGQVAQAVAHGLGIPLDFVKVRPNQNNVTPNAFATGGSTTSERCVASALGAVSILKERLAPFREKMPDAPWPGLVQAAHFGNTHLQASSCHFQNGDPLVYFTYMTSVTETELDVLTGEYQVRRVDIMADLGESLNPTIDIGQIEGGFTFGLGVYLLEDVKYNEMTGAVLTDGTFEYKPPTTKDIPIDWRIHLMPDAPNPVGILSSKAVGEPPVGLAVSALLAIRTAAHSVRDDLEKTDGETVVEAPFTVEKAQQMIGITVDNLRVI